MKILHICKENPNDIVGGRGIHIRNLIDNLNKIKDTENFLITSSNSKTELFEDRFEIFPVNRVFIIDAYVNFFQTNMAYYHETLKQIDFFRKFDLIHLHDSDLSLFATSLSDYLNIPIVFTIHLMSSKVQSDNSISNHLLINHLYEQDAMMVSSKIITVSKSYGEQVVREHRIPADIFVVPNGVNQFEYENFKKPNSKFTVFFAGRICEQKGLPLLIDSIRLSIKSGMDFKWIVCGKVNLAVGLKIGHSKNIYMDELQQLQHNFPENVVLAGHLENEEVLKLGASSDAWVVPSFHAPFEIVGLEAMSVKTPLVCTKIGGFLEYANEENSVFIDFNPQDVINKLNWIKENKDKAVLLTDKALEISKQFSWEKTACLTKSVYEEALKGCLA